MTQDGRSRQNASPPRLASRVVRHFDLTDLPVPRRSSNDPQARGREIPGAGAPYDAAAGSGAPCRAGARMVWSKASGWCAAHPEREPEMNPSEADREPEERVPARLLELLIRAGLILALALLCYRVLAPFLVLMVWSLILAVALYPLQQAVARRIGERQGLAATLITALGVVLIVAPTALLLSSMGDSVQHLIRDVQHDTLRVPPPRPNVAAWPVVGEKVYAFWEKAHADLPELVRSLQPKVGNLAKAALAMVASIGGVILQFIAALIIAGIIMAFGQAGDRGGRAIFARLAGEEHAAEFSHLAVGTIRAVAQGVIGVAFIQAIIIGVD